MPNYTKDPAKDPVEKENNFPVAIIPKTGESLLFSFRQIEVEYTYENGEQICIMRLAQCSPWPISTCALHVENF